MFSGGEKKSFYKLNLVIGTFIIALKLKRIIHYMQNNVLSSIYAVTTLKVAKSSIFSVYTCFYRHVPCSREQVKNTENKDYRPLGSYLEA
jgi:hypothetical protein